MSSFSDAPGRFRGGKGGNRQRGRAGGQGTREERRRRGRDGAGLPRPDAANENVRPARARPPRPVAVDRLVFKTETACLRALALLLEAARGGDQAGRLSPQRLAEPGPAEGG